MKRHKKMWSVGLVVLLAGAALWWGLRGNKKSNGTHTRSYRVETGPIEQTVEATGEVAPLNRVEIKPPISGRMEVLLVDEGDRVKTGQILAWLSSSDRAAVIDAARAKGPEEAKRWEDTYKPTPIIAPLSGVIILRNVVIGQTVETGTILYAISDKLIVIAHVDEADIGMVKTGMPARIVIDAYPDQAIAGHVFNVLYEGTNVSNVISYGVKIEPETVPSFFRSQMTANISLILQRKESALLLPSLAVSGNGAGEKQVLVPGADGKPMPKVVTVGLDNGEKVEILSGLNEGDTVMTVSKRYVPQQAQASSPLIMGGRPGAQPAQSGQQGQSGQRSSSSRSSGPSSRGQ